MIRAFACAVLTASPCAADPAAEAFAAWRAAHQIGAGALAVIRDGRLASFDQGWEPDAPAELSSLSKAITALCVASLVDEGRLEWTQRVPGLDVTLAQLVLHSGGIGPDSTQGARGILRYLRGEEAGAVAARVRARKRQEGQPGRFAYNNENYALLSEVIAGIGPPGELCAARVLAPAGVRGGASPRSGNSLSWGGWALSPEAYARLHAHWFGTVRADPRATPLLALDGGQVFYGLGSFVRFADPAPRFWHYGATCIPGRETHGAFVMTEAGRWTVMAAYDGCLDDPASRALGLRLFEAMQGG